MVTRTRSVLQIKVATVWHWRRQAGGTCEHAVPVHELLCGLSVRERGHVGTETQRRWSALKGHWGPPVTATDRQISSKHWRPFLKRGPPLGWKVIVSLWLADDWVQGQKQAGCTRTGRRRTVRWAMVRCRYKSHGCTCDQHKCWLTGKSSLCV